MNDVKQACIQQLLIRGLADWTYATELSYIVRSVGGANEFDENLEFSVQLLREMQQLGLLQIGDIYGEGCRFREWEGNDDERIARVRQEWSALGRTPDLCEVCWFNNTVKGDEVANQALAAGVEYFD